MGQGYGEWRACGNPYDADDPTSRYVPICSVLPEEAEPDINDAFLTLLCGGVSNPCVGALLLAEVCGSIVPPNLDGDGYWALECGGSDCSEAPQHTQGSKRSALTALITIAADTSDLCGDACDQDMDGVKSLACGGADCMTQLAAKRARRGLCGLDNDCKPETRTCASVTKMVMAMRGSDCRPRPTVYPGAVDPCGDFIDSDCSGDTSEACDWLSGQDGHMQLIGKSAPGPPRCRFCRLATLTRVDRETLTLSWALLRISGSGTHTSSPASPSALAGRSWLYDPAGIKRFTGDPGTHFGASLSVGEADLDGPPTLALVLPE